MKDLDVAVVEQKAAEDCTRLPELCHAGTEKKRARVEWCEYDEKRSFTRQVGQAQNSERDKRSHWHPADVEGEKRPHVHCAAPTNQPGEHESTAHGRPLCIPRNSCYAHPRR